MKNLVIALLLLTCGIAHTQSLSTGTVKPVEIKSEKELMITDLSVVESTFATESDGAWTFGHLIKSMSGEQEPSRFLVNWLKIWETNQIVNDLPVKERPRIRELIIDPWKKADGQEGVSDDDWVVNFDNAPMRLLAIANRIDLHRNVLNAGEGRFVFGVLARTFDADGASTLSPLRFTIIFEYEQVATRKEDLEKWASDWHALGAMEFGEQYNVALREITEKFAGEDAIRHKPNGSALNQIRTNEIPLGGEWELREFQISRQSGFLEQVDVKQTPDIRFNNSATLTHYIEDNMVDIEGRRAEIPTRFLGQSFRAGSAGVPIGFFWDAPNITNNEARHLVSLNSCNGCHHRETGTMNFLHVFTREKGKEAGLSGFLTGIEELPNGTKKPFVVADPVSGELRPFNDLQGRKVELEKLLPPSSPAEALIMLNAPKLAAPATTADKLRPVRVH